MSKKPLPILNQSCSLVLVKKEKKSHSWTPPHSCARCFLPHLHVFAVCHTADGVYLSRNQVMHNPISFVDATALFLAAGCWCWPWPDDSPLLPWCLYSTATSPSWPAPPHSSAPDPSTAISTGVTPRRLPWLCRDQTSQSRGLHMPHVATDSAARAVDAPVACRHRRRWDQISQHVAVKRWPCDEPCRSPPPSKPGPDNAGRTPLRTFEPRSSLLPLSTPAPNLAVR